jgi:Zn-dependent M28 family amino/carboxypeptidase
MKKYTIARLLLTCALSSQVILTTACSLPVGSATPVEFDGDAALQHIQNQVDLGMRIPGSPAHAEVIQYISDQLNQVGWSVEVQQVMDNGQEIQNIVASKDNEASRVILGAHYDTREFADRDPDPENRKKPVPGANDGASGVAVLLEIARVLPASITGVTLLFIDAEDQGDINGQSWIRGATLFVENNYTDPSVPKPEAAVIIDMIGDADLNIYYENNSDQKLREEIWTVAESLNYSEQFIPKLKYTIIDDHIPFKNAGIPAVDLIDFDYPYWHTIGDTPDKTSAQSLEAVGRTLIAWLKSSKP